MADPNHAPMSEAIVGTANGPVGRAGGLCDVAAKAC
jgi:hypothetical protein